MAPVPSVAISTIFTPPPTKWNFHFLVILGIDMTYALAVLVILIACRLWVFQESEEEIGERWSLQRYPNVYRWRSSITIVDAAPAETNLIDVDLSVGP